MSSRQALFASVRALSRSRRFLSKSLLSVRKVVVYTAIFLTFVSPLAQGYGAITIVDAVQSQAITNTQGANDAQSTFTKQYTVSAGANVLVVQWGAFVQTPADNALTSITWNGTPLLKGQVYEVGSTGVDSQIFYLYNPTPAVNGSLVVNSTNRGAAFGEFTLSGVDTSVAPVLTGNTNNGNPSVVVTLGTTTAGQFAAIAEDCRAPGTGTTPYTTAASSPATTPIQQFTTSEAGGQTWTGGAVITDLGAATGTTITVGNTGDTNGNPRRTAAVAIFTPITFSSINWVGGGSNNWTDGTQWQGGSAPNSSSSAAVFGNTSASGTVTLNANQTVGGITFNGNVNTTISGANTLTLDGGSNPGTITVAGGTHVLSSSVALNTNTNITSAASSQLTLGGVVSNAGATPRSLSFLGSGTIVLSNTNTYSGGSAVNGGTVRVGSGSLGSTGNISFAGGTLQYATGNTENLSTRLKNSTTAPIKLDVNGNTVSYGGVIDNSNTAGLTLSSTAAGGKLILGAANTFTGAATVNSGTLQLNDANALQNNTLTTTSSGGSVAFNAGISPVNLGGLAGSGNIAMTDTGSGTVNLSIGANNVSTAYSGNLTGGGSLTKVGSGTLTLSGANQLGSTVRVQGGTLKVQGVAVGLIGQFYNNTPANSNNSNPDFASRSAFTSHFAALSPAVTTNLTVGPKTNLDFSNTNYGNNAPFNALGATTGNYGFTNADNLETVFTGYIDITTAGSYTFGTTSDDGSVLYIDGGDGQAPNNGGTLVNNNFFQGANRRTGTVNLTAGQHAIQIGFYEGGGGAGLLVDYSGADTGNVTTTIPMNVLKTGLLSAPGPLPTSSQVMLSSTTTFDISSSLLTVGSIADAPGTPTGSTVALGTGALTTGGDGLDTSFNGTFTGTGTLVKTGGGTFTLTGNNSAGFATTVNGGILRVANGGNLGNGAITVASTGKLQVRPNTGSTINAGASSSLAVAAGGVFDMSGDSQAGTFRVGTLSLANTSVLNFDVGTSGLNTVVDSLAVTGVASDVGTTTINITGYGNSNLANGLYPIVTAASGLTTGAFQLGNSTVTVNGINYALALVPSGTQELLRITAPALNGSWIQAGATPPHYSWGTAGNWQSGQVPGAVAASGDTATFASANTQTQIVDLDANRFIGVLTFNNTTGGNYTINSNGFTFNLDGGGAGAVVTNSTGTNVFSGAVNMADSAIVNTAGSTSVAFQGVVSGSGKSLTVNTAGSGIVVLNATNTFNGGLTVAGGTLQVPTINNVSTPGPLGNNSSVTLGAIGGFTGTIEYTGVGNVTSSMPLALAGGGGGGLTVDDSGSTVDLTGNITTTGTGVGSFAVNGPGTVQLSGSGNSFAGGLNINGGTLRVNNAAAGTIGSGIVTFGGSNTPTLNLKGNSPTVAQLSGSGTNGIITNSAGGLSTLTLNGSTTSTYNGAINAGTGNISLIVTGGGTQVLGGTSTFSGGVAVQNGTLQVASSGGIGSANAVTLGSGANNGTLIVGGSSAANVTIASLATSGTGTTRVVGGASANSTLTITSASPISFSPTIFGGTGTNQNNLAVSFTGGSTVTLSGVNTYTGGTTISNGGTLVVPTLIAGTNPYGTGAINLAGATLALQGQSNIGLTGKFYNNGPNNDGANPNRNANFYTQTAFDSHFASLTPAVTTNLGFGGKSNLDFSNNGYGNGAPFNAAGATTGNYGFTNADQLETVFTGYINITTPGNYNFGTTSDDGSVLYIDGGDGLTPNNGLTAVYNNAYQGNTRKTNLDAGGTGATIPLSAGLHAIKIGFYEGGGGAGLLVDYSGPDTSNAVTTIPMSVLRLTTSGTYTVGQSYSNAVNVTADSTVNVTNSLNASVGALTIGANTLNVTSSDNTANPFSLTTGTVRLTGNATFNVGNSTGNGPGTLNLPAVTETGGSQSLTKTGPGTLVLTSGGSTYSGGTNVNGGVVVAQRPGSLGTGTVSIADGNTLQVVANPSASISGFNGGAGWATPNRGQGPYTPAFNGNTLQMTDNNNGEATSVFYNAAQPIQTGNTGFTASFTYQVVNPTNGQADGAAFVLQNAPGGTTVVGNSGTSLGYSANDNGAAAFSPSAAFEINIYNGHPGATNFVNSTQGSTSGTYVNGSSGAINFGGGGQVNVTLAYDPVAQTLTETDTDGVNTPYTHVYTGVNLQSILGGTSALIGFTAGTGGANAAQVFSNFSYNSGAGGSTYGNAVSIAGGASATIDIVPTTISTVGMGNLTTGAGAEATLNVTANSAPDNTAFGLSLTGGTLGSNLNVVVNNNGSGAGTVTIGAISGLGKSLSLGGSGAVVLNATNSYSGNTNINSGTLRLTGGSTNNIASSPVIALHDGATLDVTGLASNSITLASGQTLAAIGAAPSVHGNVIAASGSRITGGSGTALTIDGSTGLTLNDGSTVSVALAGAPGGAGVNPMFVLSAGSLTLNTTSTIELTGTLASGTYDLFSFASGSGPSSGFSITNLTGNNSLGYSIAYLAHEVDLVVSNPAVSAEWKVNADGNYNTSSNWNPAGVPNGATLTATFGNGNLGQITGNPTAIHVTVDTAATVGHLLFNNTTGVTYSLDSDGTHSLSLNNSGGMATIDASANANINSNLVLADSQGTTITVATGKTLDISGAISGSAGTNGLTKSGSGTLTIDMPSSYTGATRVNVGTLRTTFSGTIGSGDLIVNNSGTTLELGADQSVSSLSGSGGTVQVDTGVTLTVNQAATTAYHGAVTLVDPVIVKGGLTKDGSGSLTIDGPVSVGASTKLTSQGSGSLSVSGNTLTIGDNARINVKNTASLTLAPTGGSIGQGVVATVDVGASLTLAGTVSSLGSATVANRTHVVDNGSVTVGTAGQIVGGIDGGDNSTSGAGTLTVNDNATLQADHVLVDTIVIGNTSAGGAVLTLAASMADGSPTASLGGSGSGNSIGLSHLLATRSLLAHSHSSLATGSTGGSGSASSLSSGSLGSTAAVPEPSSIVLLGLGALAGLGVAIRRRNRR